MNINDIMQQAVPRRTLSEKCFRKYEQDIATACQGSTIIIPPKSQKPSSYVHGINEAMLAYRKFNYKSTLIPPSYNLYHIKAVELADGTVILRNNIADSDTTNPYRFKLQTFDAADHINVERIIGMIVRNEAAGPIKFRFTNDADLAYIRSFHDGAVINVGEPVNGIIDVL